MYLSLALFEQEVGYNGMKFKFKPIVEDLHLVIYVEMR